MKTTPGPKLPTTLQEALVVSRRLELLVKASSAKLHAIPGTGSGRMGLTPDHVRADPKWQAAKRELDANMAAERRFNGWYTKKFKRELREWRRAGGRYSQIKLPEEAATKLTMRELEGHLKRVQASVLT